jgi:FkbM family methyltransferase
MRPAKVGRRLGGFSKIIFNRLGTGALFQWLLALRERKFLFLAWWRGSYSQHGEDRFLLEYFGSKKGIYIDVGASHPFIISNTYLLWKHGWRGVTVEPIPYLYERHLRFRKGDVALNVAVGDKPGRLEFHQLIPSVLSTFDSHRAAKLVQEGCLLRGVVSVEVSTVGLIYEGSLRGQEIDVLSIDVEGLDLLVLKGVDWEQMAPRVIVCEINSDSAESIDNFLALHRYRQIKDIGCNRVYARSY